MGNGAQANNPWLQELPDPVSKVTWDNYAMLSPALANRLLELDVMNNPRHADKYEVEPEKPLLKITIGNRSVILPALIIPALDNNTIAIAVGYGRGNTKDESTTERSRMRIGGAAVGAGKNVFPLMPFDGTSFLNSAPAKVEKASGDYALAQTQVHGFYENRPVIYETNLKDFTSNPKHVLAHAAHEREILVPHGKTCLLYTSPSPRD